MVFVNQFTGDLFADVVDTLRQLPGHHFLITGESSHNWSNVRRLNACRLRRRRVVSRLLSWLTFTLQSLVYLLRHGNRQHILFVTNPPMAIWLGPLLRKLLDCRYSVLLYDLYPQVLVARDLVSPTGAVARLWWAMNRWAFRHAEHIITLGPGMYRLVLRHGLDHEPDRLSVIENWADTDFFEPLAKPNNPFLGNLRLTEKFVVSYAGSFGATHGVETILECARLLQGRDDVHFLLVGGGTEDRLVRKRVTSEKLHNLTKMPFQPREQFRFVAAAADVSVILLRPGLGNAVLPSKLYTALAAGTAILLAADPDSDAARLVETNGCGVVVAPEDPAAMADAIARMAAEPDRTAELKRNARRAALDRYSRQSQCRKYLELFSPAA